MLSLRSERARFVEITSLRAQGYTFEDIAQYIGVSSRTIRTEMKKHEGVLSELVDELVRMQLREITTLVPLDDYKSRLKWRSDLIYKLGRHLGKDSRDAEAVGLNIVIKEPRARSYM